MLVPPYVFIYPPRNILFLSYTPNTQRNFISYSLNFVMVSCKDDALVLSCCAMPLISSIDAVCSSTDAETCCEAAAEDSATLYMLITMLTISSLTLLNSCKESTTQSILKRIAPLNCLNRQTAPLKIAPSYSVVRISTQLP